MRALFIIDSPNSLYHEGMYPRTPESWRAYAAFAGACAAHYKGHGILWEIWNEPDNQVWNPSPSPEQYVKMARLAQVAIKHAHPEALVLGPAISQFWYPFLEPCFDSGLLDNVEYILLLKGPKGYRIAAWTSGTPRDITIPCEASRATLVTMLGDRSLVPVNDGKLTLKLSGSPLYVELGKMF